MFSILDLIIPSLLRKRFVHMFAYDHNHVAVLVCGRFGRHSCVTVRLASRVALLSNI